MTATRRIRTGFMAVALAATVGCSNPLNEQIDLVGTTKPLPALADAGAATDLNGRPSLLDGLDRQDWPTVTVQVPRDQVAHYPTYAKNFRWQKQRGPWDPAYPAAADAVVDPTDAGQDVADAWTDPFYTAAMLVWAPIDMIFITQPWQAKRSPSEPYAMVPDRVPAHLVDWFDAPNKLQDIPSNDTPDDTPDDAPDDAPADRGQPHP